MNRVFCRSAVVVLGLALAACSQPDPPPHSTNQTPTPQASPTPTEVKTVLVAADSSDQPLVLSARLTYAENGYSRISSPLQGLVLDIRAKLGQAVKAGDVLMVIDAADIARAYAAYVAEISELGLAERNYELTKDLYDAQAMSLKDLEHAENDLNRERAEFKQAKGLLLSLRVPASELSKPLDQQQITSRFELRSPLTGTVVERNVTPGQIVGVGSDQPLFTVADLDRLQVVADIYERDLPGIHSGVAAALSVEAYPGLEIPAVIDVISDVVDPATRTIKLRASVPNDDRRLKPEMFARLSVAGRTMTPKLVIPKQAVMDRAGKKWVLIQQAPGRYEERAVTVDDAVGNQVPVREGLTVGERVVLTPTAINRVAVTESRAGGAYHSVRRDSPTARRPES